MENANCHFGKLSPELRNEVYSYLLPENQTIQLIPKIQPPGNREKDFKEVQPPITRACSQIRGETKPMLYGNNEFIIPLGDHVSVVNEYETIRNSVLRAAAWLRRNPANESPLKGQLVFAVHILVEDWTDGMIYVDRAWGELVRALQRRGYSEKSCVVKATLRWYWDKYTEDKSQARQEKKLEDASVVEAMFQEMGMRCEATE
ncbi:unnamed protein product [Zymoseptoria tritici ST99CH_3D1]|uniref:Uncharacterized protein n=2 Tax=Zymoseptoria tritici TaxID=1047171 RepID=A0A1X7S1R3_ZYMT9|nr:unnamed protein product [Zymoseptoria tritici ST99CH_3D7]SMR57173.1 unnamed protein product [Zymoseptoria tritici ST99CH_1E4]SMR60046.1 unnamed protein product [Zymoseptoria tritici ST99CH_3D1]